MGTLLSFVSNEVEGSGGLDHGFFSSSSPKRESTSAAAEIVSSSSAFLTDGVPEVVEKLSNNPPSPADGNSPEESVLQQLYCILSEPALPAKPVPAVQQSRKCKMYTTECNPVRATRLERQGGGAEAS
ncbi:hypothetical protein THAOC_16551 [Thalassiosira oceanica]|uniref:Uncharacterized protein n=1 Tax=Thalassiosira oceanica TaxID=159749 RepID=K0SBW9_THAOC|nr:hypothetical protein THAOC_16551 [Thalassiosira oceanica]|mmetsp:Transcript_1844/g.4299  ORF Transcript_1844/g.4299 Transcript_1844/m.4299 type:complete len:128 (+) Transcript_1844:121-504(+)|eukprot:EJK62820.1 hypothetical protein THAOC_16551 [Thalassiosira oceanica]